jgi:hypothetical protein
VQFRRIEVLDRLSDTQQTRIAHAQDRLNHASSPLI